MTEDIREDIQEAEEQKAVEKEKKAAMVTEAAEVAGKPPS